MNLNFRKIFLSKSSFLTYLYLLVTLIFTVKIINLHIFPLKYVLILIVIEILLYLLLLRLILSKKYRWKIIGSCLCLIVSLIMFWVDYQFSQFDIFFENQTLTIHSKNTLDIVVLKESDIKSINDLSDKKVSAPTSLDLKNISLLIDDLKTKHNIELSFKDENSYSRCAKMLIDKKASAMVLNSHYRNIINDVVPDFTKKIRIIYSVNLENHKTIKSHIKDITNEPFNIFLSGNDAFGELTNEGRSDTNIIASINPNTHEILLTTIPRDLYVKLAIDNPNAYDKLTHASNFGVATSVQTISDLLSIKIPYHVRINFSSLINIVNSIGGVTVNNPEYFNTFDMKEPEYQFVFDKGPIHLNGKQALAYSRERHYFNDERMRGLNQQRIIEAIIKKVTRPENIINFGTILKSLGNIYQTNISQDEIRSLIKLQLDDNIKWNIKSISLNGTSAIGHFSYMMPSNDLYVMLPYKENIDYAKECIANIFSGTQFKVDPSKYEPENPTILNEPVQYQ